VTNLAEIHLGTSAFTAAGSEGPFYPKGIKPADRLAFYAEHFDAVEIDSTSYACPLTQVVKGWASKTPEKFIVAVKVPQIITHDKILAGCDTELKQLTRPTGTLKNPIRATLSKCLIFNHRYHRARCSQNRCFSSAKSTQRELTALRNPARRAAYLP